MEAEVEAEVEAEAERTELRAGEVAEEAEHVLALDRA